MLSNTVWINDGGCLEKMFWSFQVLDKSIYLPSVHSAAFFCQQDFKLTDFIEKATNEGVSIAFFLKCQMVNLLTLPCENRSNFGQYQRGKG